MNDTEDRLTELEIRITHQDRLLEELNEVITADARRLRDLEQEVDQLRRIIETLGPELTASPDE